MEKGLAIKAAELIIKENCTGCGACLASCSAGALSLETTDANGWGEKQAVVDRQACPGCGDCVPACPRHSLSLRPLKVE